MRTHLLTASFLLLVACGGSNPPANDPSQTSTTATPSPTDTSSTSSTTPPSSTTSPASTTSTTPSTPSTTTPDPTSTSSTGSSTGSSTMGSSTPSSTTPSSTTGSSGSSDCPAPKEVTAKNLAGCKTACGKLDDKAPKDGKCPSQRQACLSNCSTKFTK